MILPSLCAIALDDARSKRVSWLIVYSRERRGNRGAGVCRLTVEHPTASEKLRSAFIRIRDGSKRLAEDPRYKWYKRIVWGASAIWAAVVVAQSVPYYTYTGNGRSLMAQGQYAQAEEMFRAALKDVQESFCYRCVGPRDKRFASALNNLAELHRTVGRYADAEKEYILVKDVTEKFIGCNHEEYALSLNNLAALYRDEGRYSQSEDLYKSSIACWEKTLHKAQDSKFAASLNGLAKVYRDEGRYAEAEPLYLRAIAIRSKALGPDHQDVAEIVGNLGGLYRDEGRYKQSEHCYLKAVAVDTRALGLQHPFVADDFQNLAALYREEGRYQDAQSLYLKALSIRRLQLGPAHPAVAKSLLGLAENARQMGDLPSAKSYLDQALKIDDKTLGTSHPDYATVCDTMCRYFRAKADNPQLHSAGDTEEAYSWIRKALAVRETTLSATNPDLATSKVQLADLYRRSSRLAESENLYKQVLQTQQKILGPDHRAVAETLYGLAKLYEAEHKVALAQATLIRAQDIRTKLHLRAIGPV